jgi:cystathionine beta-lyase/cystathionine gamma-synthase
MLNAEQLREADLPPSPIRLAVGFEFPAALIADLDSALAI